MPEHPKSAHRPRATLALGAAVLLALGGAAGAVVTAETRPTVKMAPAVPVAIRSLSDGIVTVRGRVAEIYGNRFTIDDGTGRALIDTGPEGDGGALVAIGQPVIVQGRFERGFVHAAFLIGPDRKVLALGPLAGPPHGAPDGPSRGPGAPPPPPPGAVPPPAPGAVPLSAPTAVPAKAG